MAVSNTSASTQASIGESIWEGRRIKWLRQEVPITHGAAFAAFTANLPARCRAVWGYVKNQTAIAVTGNDGTSTANAIALVMHPTTATAPLTQPQTATVSSPTGGTNGCMLMLQTSTASNAEVRGPARFETSAPAVNTNTVPALLVLQPAFTNSNRLYANGTNGFVFGTSTATSTTEYAAEVTVYFEEFADAPNKLNR